MIQRFKLEIIFILNHNDQLNLVKEGMLFDDISEEALMVLMLLW